jgi:3-carboxy-cis,cis-muconate cycloisomerase
VLPLIRQLTPSLPAELNGFVHWGATTQDIMDTASMLQIRRGLELVKQELHDLVGSLSRLAAEHRDT